MTATSAQAAESREHVAEETALTCETPAIHQTAAAAFEAALWSFTIIDTTRSAS